MTSFSAAQAAAMQQQADQRQARLVATKVRQLWPQRTQGVAGDVLGRFSLACVQDAHATALWDDRSVVRLANMRMAFGARFPDAQSHPQWAALLGQAGEPEAERLAKLWVAVAQAGAPVSRA